MTRTMLLIGGLSLLLASGVHAAKYYKWVDNDGSTHYTTEPPPEQPAQEVTTGNTASSSQDQELEALKSRRQQRSAAKQQAREEEKAAQNPAQANRERCEQHHKNLETLQNKPVVRRKNPETGELEVLDQSRRERMIERTRKALEKC